MAGAGHAGTFEAAWETASHFKIVGLFGDQGKVVNDEHKPEQSDDDDEHNRALKMSGFGTQFEVPTNGPGKWVILALALCMVIACLSAGAYFIIRALRDVPAVSSH